MSNYIDAPTEQEIHAMFMKAIANAEAKENVDNQLELSHQLNNEILPN